MAVLNMCQLVTAFAVSATASNWDRIGKPFNPLLGETYHLERYQHFCACRVFWMRYIVCIFY